MVAPPDMGPDGLALKTMIVDDNDFGDSPRGLVLAQLDMDMQPLPHFLKCVTDELGDPELPLQNYFVHESNYGKTHQHEDLHQHASQQHKCSSEQERTTQQEAIPNQCSLSLRTEVGARRDATRSAGDGASSNILQNTRLEAINVWKPGAVDTRLLSLAEAVDRQATASTIGMKGWPPGATTVMLRNLPNRYTAEELIAEMLAAGFEGAFDFFYLPIDFSTKRNKGYCFINFHSQFVAGCFVQRFDKQRLTRYTTRKILEVSPALTQGLEANVAQYARKDAQRVQNPWFRPMIFTLHSTQNIMDRLSA